MAVWFYPGQEDYITKLNELGAIAELLSGPDGWSPVLAVVADGERRVFQVADWVGGETTKPPIGDYVGSTGYVSNIADAIDIRGPQGVDGADGAAGPSNILSIGTVTGGTTASATITGTSPSQVLNLVLPKGDPGTNGADGLAATIAVGTVTTGAPGTSATVVNSGTSSAAVFDFTIPRGDTGSGGGGSGDVVGPASSVSNHVALFDDTTGKLLKDGGALSTVATTGVYADLTGKPTLGTASSLNVASAGNAATGEVVKGDDTRLADARTPTAHTHGTSDVIGLNTALLALSDHLGATANAHPASAIVNTPAGGVAATTVQAAINELDTEKLSDAPSDTKTYGRKDGAWAEVVATQQLQRVGVFADGASALTPASSGEVIFDTQVDTGLAANTSGVVFSNSLFIATGSVTGVATAPSAAGPWTLRSFAASLGGSSPRIGTDGTNSMVSASGTTAVARSTNGTTWTSATALPGNTATGAVPVCIGGVWLIAATTATSVYRSNNHGASWTTETINAPVESTIFRLGTRFCYFNASAIYHSTLGTSADFAFFPHGLGFTPAQITPLPDGTCAFIDPATGQVYLATDFNVLTLQTGVFCPPNHRILRINGVWVFVPLGSTSLPSGQVYTASSSGMALRLAASFPSYGTPTQPAMTYAVSGGVTVLPRAVNNLGASFNGWVMVVTHSTSRQVYFAGA